jgi:hypothetical protein
MNEIQSNMLSKGGAGAGGLGFWEEKDIWSYFVLLKLITITN